MSSTYNGNAASITPHLAVAITEPADGDPAAAASVNVGLSKLADYSEYLQEKAALLDQANTFTAEQTLTAATVSLSGTYAQRIRKTNAYNLEVGTESAGLLKLRQNSQDALEVNASYVACKNGRVLTADAAVTAAIHHAASPAGDLEIGTYDPANGVALNVFAGSVAKLTAAQQLDLLGHAIVNVAAPTPMALACESDWTCATAEMLKAPNGHVQFRGSVINNAGSSAVIAILPSGFRPLTGCYWCCVRWSVSPHVLAIVNYDSATHELSVDALVSGEGIDLSPISFYGT